MRSAVSKLSLMSTGTPCSGPRGPLALRSRSRAAAMASASGLISITVFSAGPFLSSRSIRFRYHSVTDRLVERRDRGSGEGRGGEEGRSRGGADHLKKKKEEIRNVEMR